MEIGWRLARSSWEHGYATEAARAAMTFGFETCDLAEILAITAAANHRSHAVMRRLGVTHDPTGAFDDTTAPEGPIRHVVYRITR
ncbi:N-acetyltransferase [Kribbella turkmenica]|uniref:N-acetyltransferase n=1 Tax=Kribbella turkmenica TaxID=2530375 RepID=A0A4R4X149_9ACTN|nr:N-acetyltransferase [Kribbella turkmenica]